MNVQENKTEDVIEVDLVEICHLLLRRWWLILTGALLAGTAGFLFSFFVVPDKYKSTTEIYILNDVETVTYSDLQMGTQLTKDYAHLITTRDVLEQVIGELGLEESYEGLKSRVSVETPADTRIVAITVEDRSPQMAQTIANQLREAASQHITNVMAIDAVNVASVANYPQKPSSPSVSMWTLTGALIGGLLCVAVVLVKYLMDDSIKTSEDVEKYLELSTLGMIPVNNEEEAEKRRGKRYHSKDFDEGAGDAGGGGLEEIELEEKAGGKEDR